MQPGIQAYAKTQSLALSQRELEARALLKAASRLQALKENWDPSIAVIEDPLAHNRKVWAIFLASATEDDCPMPPEMRKNIIGLSRFVINQCMRILFEPDVTKLDLLIEINQHVAAGLRGNAGPLGAPSSEQMPPRLPASQAPVAAAS
ncbi:MAG: flagellar biosynthesis regulator FlaF [Hyphomicrobiales bacterium]|uniref:flagellar biosynthesis regulator FlaF n=1 Tax=Rhabdaerophilum calidifontis TaxID=2604328 RepID=UPI00123A41D6|nr:flagellar biosynthesis regulator FlaF [Rhabdaerophilum calidifontis]MCA1952270.1 flagellar biosynthesis regulator FlaF [Hyphomicrobiales bacterium]